MVEGEIWALQLVLDMAHHYYKHMPDDLIQGVYGSGETSAKNKDDALAIVAEACWGSVCVRRQYDGLFVNEPFAHLLQGFRP